MSIAGIINTNTNALFTQNKLNGTAGALNQALSRLASGKKINGPADDPAGFAIGQRFTTQINGMNQAISNANQATSLIQTATGAIQQSTNILQQIRTIAVQAANGSNSDSDRQALQGVVSQLQAQISTIAKQTQYNGKSLLDGSFGGQQFQVGANANQVLGISIGDARATSIGVNEVNKYAVGNNVITDGAAATPGGYTVGSLTVNGSAGSNTLANAVVAATDSAADVAKRINAVESSTNVTAIAKTEQTFTVGDGAFNFVLGNGTAGAGQTNTANISANVVGGDVSDLVKAINGQSAKTGVIAETKASGQITLKNLDGDNISMTGVDEAGTLTSGTLVLGGATPAATSALVQGVVTFQSDKAMSVAMGTAAIGGMAATTSYASTLDSVAGLSVKTADDATKALQIVDAAIKGLNGEGAGLGALQQRVQATVSNLETASTNLTASRSVVEDANIAQETSAMARAQILQQAGISTMAHANQLQQSFLKLLP